LYDQRSDRAFFSSARRRLPIWQGMGSYTRNSEYNGRLTRRLREAIAKAPMTRSELERRAGISENSLLSFMRRKYGANLRTADALAEVLNLDLVSSGPVEPGRPVKRGRPPKRSKADKKNRACGSAPFGRVKT